MKMRKLSKVLAICLALAMVLSCSSVFAAPPSLYDGQSYSAHGYTSDDPDGQFNLAVTAKSDVKLYGDGMYILGSVYSNGNIYAGDGQGNKVDGLFISGTEGSIDESNDGNNLTWECDGYIHVNDNGTRDGITYYSTKPEYAGAIKDTNTSFECSYAPFTVPAIANELKADNWSGVDLELNVYGQDQSQWGGTVNTTARTITEDTHIGTTLMNGSWGPALTIDTTNGPVNVVIDEIVQNSQNINIKVVGNNDANIYIGKLPAGIPVIINNDNTAWPMAVSGSTDKTHLYITGDNVVLGATNIAVADITVNAQSLEVSGSTKIYGDITSNVKNFTIVGTAEVYGTVCVPDAYSRIADSGTLYGQLHTDVLEMNGHGRILYKADSAVAGGATPEPEATTAPEVTSAPEATTEPTDSTDEYEKLGAKVIWYDVQAGTYELGRIKLVGHTPWGEENADMHYTVLDENTYYTTDEQLSDADWNEAVRRVTLIQEISQDALSLDVAPEDWWKFGRIDSNGWRESLSVTPYAYREIQQSAGQNMYLCIGDGAGNINHALMIIDENVHYEDEFEGNISPIVYDFHSQGFKSFKHEYDV